MATEQPTRALGSPAVDAQAAATGHPPVPSTPRRLPGPGRRLVAGTLLRRGVTPFLQILQLMEYKGLSLAPHFAMEIHLHLAATFSREPWTEHFEWLEPLFNERLEIRGGRMYLPDRAGHGFTLSAQARKWTVEAAEFGKRP